MDLISLWMLHLVFACMIRNGSYVVAKGRCATVGICGTFLWPKPFQPSRRPSKPVFLFFFTQGLEQSEEVWAWLLGLPRGEVLVVFYRFVVCGFYSTGVYYCGLPRLGF